MIERDHQFGGTWTTEKLEILRRYLSAYTNALKNQPFQKFYIDAFAGTGYIGNSDGVDVDAAEETDVVRLKDGSARIALQVDPPFDRFIFMEKSKKRCASLEGLKTEFPDAASAIDVAKGDCNQLLIDLCKKNWIGAGWRGVLFLDPYGMNIHWSTMEAIAATQALDVWILFSHAGVNRMLLRSGDIPMAWQQRLDSVFGTNHWRDAFYCKSGQMQIFGDESPEKHVTLNEIADFYIERLRTVFPGVASSVRILRNSRNSPLFALCFACGNKRGAKPALAIAKHLLEKW